MTEPFTRRLLSACGLDEQDATALRKALRLLPSVAAGAQIHGDDGGVVVLIAGLAYRGRVGPEGGRTITGILLPGDICHLALFQPETDQEVIALTSCSVASIPNVPLMTLCMDKPSILQALLVNTLLEAAALREWLVGMARLDAERRVARLFCELRARARLVDQTLDRVYPLPMTQTLLADALGLSVVHMSRSLKRLRLAGLATFVDGEVTIPNVDRLREFADFNSSYLRASLQGNAARRVGTELHGFEKRYLN